MAWRQMEEQQVVSICELFGWFGMEVRFRLTWYGKLLSLAWYGLSGLSFSSPAAFVPGPN
jgi:hypothetical protein